MKADYPTPITLCGIKHCGKSSCAAVLSSLTGLPLFDTDEVLKECYREESGNNFTVREIFRELGSDAFRKLEARAVHSVVSRKECFIAALGGGVLSNMQIPDEDRRKMGFLCCLEVPDSVAFQRIQTEGLPLFLAESEDPFQTFITENQKRRVIFQKEADRIIHCASSPEETARLVLSAYKEYLQ